MKILDKNKKKSEKTFISWQKLLRSVFISNKAKNSSLNEKKNHR